MGKQRTDVNLLELVNAEYNWSTTGNRTC